MKYMITTVTIIKLSRTKAVLKNFNDSVLMV